MDIEIHGTIKIDDVARQFSMSNNGDVGWQQWGQPTEELGKSVAVLDALQLAIYEEFGS